MLRSGALLLRRVVVTVVGAAVLVVGAVMLVAPGPGFLVLALGLVILGSEYAWARRRLETVRRKVTEIADAAVANPWSTAGSVVSALALVVGGVVWASVPSLPFSGWTTGSSLVAGGLIALATIVVSLVQARRQRAAAVPRPRTETASPDHASRGEPDPAGSPSGLSSPDRSG